MQKHLILAKTSYYCNVSGWLFFEFLFNADNDDSHYCNIVSIIKIFYNHKYQYNVFVLFCFLHSSNVNLKEIDMKIMSQS